MHRGFAERGVQPRPRVPVECREAKPNGTSAGTRRKTREAPHRFCDPSCRSWVPGLVEFILGPRVARTRGLARDTSMRIRSARTNRWPYPHSRCQTAQCSSFPRRVVAPGFCLSFSRPPRSEGWAERRQAHYFICRVSETRRVRTQRGAARPMTRDARLSALHRGVVGPGTASIPGIAAGSGAKASRCQAIVHGGPRSRAFRIRGYERGRRHSRSACWIVSGDAPHERGCKPSTIYSLRSQEINANRSRRCSRAPFDRCIFQPTSTKALADLNPILRPSSACRM
jgi:hypothetical protein